MRYAARRDAYGNRPSAMRGQKNEAPIDRRRRSCRHDESRVPDVHAACILTPLERELRAALGFGIELGRHFGSDHAYARSRLEQRQCAPRSDATATNDQRADRLAVEPERDHAHRNWPRFNAAIRKTIYSSTTLANVTPDTTAARPACHPRRIPPRANALTQIQAPMPQTICGMTTAR